MSVRCIEKIRPNTLREILRDETLQRHIALEQRVEQGGFFETAQGYQRWLEMMHNVHARYAVAMDRGAVALGLDPISSRLRHALSQDTGLARSDTSGTDLDEATSIGVAYVFEGSAMGARVLRRRLKGLGSVSRCYIDALLIDSSQRWPQCKSALLSQPPDDGRALRGALEVFDTLFNCFGDVK